MKSKIPVAMKLGPRKSPLVALGIFEMQKATNAVQIVDKQRHCVCFESGFLMHHKSSFQKKRITAKSVAKCKSRLKNVEDPVHKKFSTSKRCPLDDNGKNSAIPWMMPNKIATQIFIAKTSGTLYVKNPFKMLEEK